MHFLLHGYFCSSICFLFTIFLTHIVPLTLLSNILTVQGSMVNLTPPRQQMPITIYEQKRTNRSQLRLHIITLY